MSQEALKNYVQDLGLIYIINLDKWYYSLWMGQGISYSKDIHCEQCYQKHHQDGSISYYHQILSAAIVHPAQKVVLPFALEPIMKEDGSKKNDCERRAAERFLNDLKREHPHLPLMITGDGLYPDGHFIKRLKQDNHRFILVAREKDLKYLFSEFRALPRESLEIKEFNGLIFGVHYVIQCKLILTLF